jgi:ribosome-associated toxin RatA of RatAB toxin-antitoxin module
MPRVEAAATIDAPLDVVYALAKDVERFPEFMPDLDTVRVLERAGNRTVTEWAGRAQGRRIRWIEEDEWDDAARVCTFRQREGDFDRYEGTWSFTGGGEAAHTRLVVDFDLNVPLIGALLTNLVGMLMRKNCENMLSALRDRAETLAKRPG